MRSIVAGILALVFLLVPVASALGALSGEIPTVVTSSPPDYATRDNVAGGALNWKWTSMGAQVTGQPFAGSWSCNGKNGSCEVWYLCNQMDPEEHCGYQIRINTMTGISAEDAPYMLTIIVPPTSGTTPSPGWWYGYVAGSTYHFPGCSVTFKGGAWYGVGDSQWHPWGQFGLLPVSVSLEGTTSVQTGVAYDYTALVSGGIAPYTVVFQRIGDLPADDYTWPPQTGSQTTYVQSIMFPSALRAYTVQVTVTDANGGTASDTLIINAHEERPTVYGYLQEGTTGSGDFLDFVCSLTHSGTYPAESEWLPCEAPGAGRYWYTLDVPAWSVHGAAHYTLRLASPWPNPLTAMITMHDTTSGDVWTLVFSFDTSGLTGPGDWIDSEGGGEQFNEEETWIGKLLNALEAMLKRVFQWLFVPSASDFGNQLSGSWIAISSPVPNVTPQYTIPIPNTGHIMADTGETVNIDFSGIQDWSGFTVTRTIVQTILDAILVFVTISIIT